MPFTIFQFFVPPGTRYPPLLGGQRQYGMRSLPVTSHHEQMFLLTYIISRNLTPVTTSLSSKYAFHINIFLFVPTYLFERCLFPDMYQKRVMSQITNAWYTMGRECKSAAVKIVVHNVLSEIWSVCIMASIWRKLKGYWVTSQEEKGEHCVCKKSDHKVALGKDL